MNYKDIIGSLTDDEADLLQECAKEAPINRFLEIGTFLGKSASVLGTVAKERQGTLLCIDFFAENMKYWHPPYSIIPNTREAFLTNMDMMGLKDSVISLKGSSNNILPNLNGKFGLIYIDGGHEVKSVLSDALMCWNHLIPGAFLIFHDCQNPSWPDVRIVVDCLMKKWGVEPCNISESKNMIAVKKCGL